MNRLTRPLSFCVVALCVTGCASNEDGSSATSYGHVGPEIVALYDVVADDGAMELELDRDGRIFEAEADVDPDRLPAVVRDAAVALAGASAVVTGAEIEYGASGRTYEVKFDRDGKGLEYVVDEAGTILEQEREIERSEAPAGVVEAAMGRIPGDFRSVEILEIGDEVVYHVKTASGARRFKAVVAPDGRVLRAVRETRAEIEIPLR
jgi:uncharacterized membrane protein YkoI